MCRAVHMGRRENSRHLRAIMESATVNRDTRTHDMVTFTFYFEKLHIININFFCRLYLEHLKYKKANVES